MKGITKALQRTPHNITSRIGMAKKTTDAEYLEHERKFAAVEKASEKILQDSTAFHQAVSSLLTSGAGFARSFTVLFSPMGAEYNLTTKHPNAEVTLRNIDQYSQFMQEMRDTLQPELDLIDTRIVKPCKELNEICKKIRKTCTKRDHKLVDFDRHNNSLNKLRDKKEKSLSDEKNLFKVEQDFEVASGDYEQYNNLLKTELPEFLHMTTRFVDPLFHSFYYMQLNVYYIIQEKLQTFMDGKYDMTRKDIENIYLEQRGDAAEQMEELTITKRQVSTAKILANARAAGGSDHSSLASRRTPSISSKPSLAPKPGMTRSESTEKSTYSPPAPRVVAAPPPYTTTKSSSSITKKAPPPPPPLKPKPSFNKATYCTAIFDFEAQAEGDLSFSAGDRIEIVERTDSADDWWTGKLNGRQGIFPGTYTQVDGE